MNNKISVGLWHVFCVILVATLLGGCGALGQSPVTAESQVAMRAQERWDLLLAGDLVKAYEYLSPGTRATRTQAQYAARIKLGAWQGAKVKSVKCKSEDQCEVVVTVDYKVGTKDGELSGSRDIFESWIKEAAIWWHFPQR